MAAADGKGGDWQGIAAANKIEDPLRLAPGTPVDLSLGVGASLGGTSAGFGISAPALPSPPVADFSIQPPRLGIN
jgi:hypothetical protein